MSIDDQMKAMQRIADETKQHQYVGFPDVRAKLVFTNPSREDLVDVFTSCLEALCQFAPSDQVFIIESSMDRTSQEVIEEALRLINEDG